MTCSVQWILFDFGGVLAEEGFVNGLRALGAEQGLDPDQVVHIGVEQVFQTGYVLGRTTEEVFWQAMRTHAGLAGSDGHFQEIILDHFTLRPWMLELVTQLRRQGTRSAVLSDQVNWLKMLNERQAFFPLFDRVFNSFEIGQSKRDPELFSRVVSWLGIAPEEALFIDDSSGNVERAWRRGLEAIHYTGRKAFTAALRTFCPGI